MRTSLMRAFILASLVFAAGCADSPVYRRSDEPLPIATVDRDGYIGLWHEQARLPNRFEHGCQRATAEYGLREDGLISVTNTCVEIDGERRAVRGRARFAGPPGVGRLEVSFFGPFWSDYWVLDRAQDYSWSIVGEPGGRYLWVLTRSETITREQRAAFEQRIADLGYRPADLVWAAP